MLAITWPDPVLATECSRPVIHFERNELLRIYELLDWDVSRFNDVDYVQDCAKHLEFHECFDFSLFVSLLGNNDYGIRNTPIYAFGFNTPFRSYEEQQKEESRRTIEREEAIATRRQNRLNAVYTKKCRRHTGKQDEDCERCVEAKEKQMRAGDLPFVAFSDLTMLNKVELEYYVEQSDLLINSFHGIYLDLNDQKEETAECYGYGFAERLAAQGIRNTAFLRDHLIFDLARAQGRLMSFSS